MPDKIKKRMSDNNFIDRVWNEVVQLIPVCEAIDKIQSANCNLAEAVDVWLQLGKNLECKVAWKKRSKKFIDNTCLIAYSMHPVFKGQLLKEKQKQKVDQLIMSVVRSSEDHEHLLNFRKGTGVFGDEKLKALSADQYWMFIKPFCPKLAEFSHTYVTTSLNCFTRTVVLDVEACPYVRTKST